MAGTAIAFSLFRRLRRPMRVQHWPSTVGTRDVTVSRMYFGWVITLCWNPWAATLPWSSCIADLIPCFPACLVYSVIQVMGPVITGLVVSGRVGAGIGAELASMKVTEQIDAIEASAINPYRLLAA